MYEKYIVIKRTTCAGNIWCKDVKDACLLIKKVIK